MPRFYWDVEQGTAAWFKLRAGIPTASEFDKVITPKKGELAAARLKYACRLIAERLLNWQAESLETIKHIEAGKANEPFAVAALEEICEIETHRVGFITSDDGRFGASPDRVLGINASRDGVAGVLEVKSPTIVKQFEYLLLGHDDAYRCQVQGQLYVAQADKAIFYAHNPRMPHHLVESGRDEPFIRKLADGLEQFSDELEEMTERAVSLGSYQAFAEMVAPVDREYQENADIQRVSLGENLEDFLAGAFDDRLLSG
jgi:hypothetical protein